MKRLSQLYKKVEDERMAVVRPFNEAVRNANDRFKRYTTPVKDAETKVKAMVAAYRDKLRREAEAAETARIKAEAEQLRRDMEAQYAGPENAGKPVVIQPPAPPAPTAPPAPDVVRGSTSTMSVKKVWDFEVTDLGLLAKECPELVVANRVEIMKYIHDGITEIPGLKIFQKEQIAVR